MIKGSKKHLEKFYKVIAFSSKDYYFLPIKKNEIPNYRKGTRLKNLNLQSLHEMKKESLTDKEIDFEIGDMVYMYSLVNKKNHDDFGKKIIIYIGIALYR